MTTSSQPNDIEGDGRWISQHTRFLCQTREREPDVVLIGDSIIKCMEFSASYKKFLEPLHCLNFGIYEDNTSHILWRIENGELDGISPKAIIIHAGNNNIGQTAEEIVDGISAIVELIHERQSSANVVVLGMLPCGREPNPRRVKYSKINDMLTNKWITNKEPNTVLLLPDWKQFIQPNGIISHRDQHDYLHPTDLGYSKLIDMMLDELQIAMPSSFLKPDLASLNIIASGESS